MDDQDNHPIPNVMETAEAGREPKEPVTRTMRNQQAVDDWRGRVLAGVTAPWTWVAVAAAYLACLAASIALDVDLHQGIAALIVAVATTVLVIWKIRSMRQNDVALRRYAALTPVNDPKILGGEIAIVIAAADTMLKTFANPNAGPAIRRLSVLGTMSAAQRIMNRGGVTPETATVNGYPEWPDVDRTEMPGNAGDFETVHLLRIDASCKRMARIADETHQRSEMLISETFATMAGEIVPPARSLLAILEAREPTSESAE